MRRTRSLYAWIGMIVLTSGVVLAQQAVKPPETFTANAQVAGKDAGSSAQVTIQIDEYTAESDRTAIQEALRIGGFPGFLPALRSAPQVGHVEMAGRKVASAGSNSRAQ